MSGARDAYQEVDSRNLSWHQYKFLLPGYELLPQESKLLENKYKY